MFPFPLNIKIPPTTSAIPIKTIGLVKSPNNPKPFSSVAPSSSCACANAGKSVNLKSEMLEGPAIWTAYVNQKQKKVSEWRVYDDNEKSRGIIGINVELIAPFEDKDE